VNPRVKVVLIEAGVTVATGVALWLLVEYAPAGVAAAGSAWRSWRAPALPMVEMNEPAISEFRASLAGPMPNLRDQLKAENWGW
jgi:hypothetical protein